MTTTQKKGPAEAATSPDHGSNPTPTGETMNGTTDSTEKVAVPDFPIFAPCQGPQDDLAYVSCKLRIIGYMMEEGCQRGMDSGTVADLHALLCSVNEELRPIQIFLDDLDCTQPLYRDCRRLAILQRNTAGAS